MKLLKQKILFALASSRDFFYKKNFAYHGYAFLYARLPSFKPSSVRGACLQLVVAGEVDKIMRDGQALFRLTAQGYARLASFFPQMASTPRSGGIIWRVLVLLPALSVAKHNYRQKLTIMRRLIKKWGFRQLQKGIYLTPLALEKQVKAYILAHGLAAQVILLEAQKLLVGDHAVLAHYLWGLDDLYEQYQKFITQAKALLTKVNQQKTLKDGAKKEFVYLFDAFFLLLKKDPALPPKTIKHNWPFRRASQLFFSLSKCFADILPD